MECLSGIRYLASHADSLSDSSRVPRGGGTRDAALEIMLVAMDLRFSSPVFASQARHAPSFFSAVY